MKLYEDAWRLIAHTSKFYNIDLINKVNGFNKMFSGWQKKRHIRYHSHIDIELDGKYILKTPKIFRMR